MQTLENLSKQELIVYQELFSIFDKEDKGSISISDFPIFIRGLGHCPTQQQLKEYYQRLNPDDEGNISFQSTIKCILQRKKQKNIEEQLLEAFDKLSEKRGGLQKDKNFKISIKQTRNKLLEHGQKLSQSEIEQFLQFLEQNNLKDGMQFNYKQMARMLSYAYME